MAVRWVPGHRGVEENEQANKRAGQAAEEKSLESDRLRKTVSLAFLKRRRTEKAHREWRNDIVRRSQGRRGYRLPKEVARPRIRPELRDSPKGVAARLYQLASGHSMTAPFLKERMGLGGVRLTPGPGNTTVGELLSDERYTEAVMDFLRKTKVGEVKSGVIRQRQETFWRSGCIMFGGPIPFAWMP